MVTDSLENLLESLKESLLGSKYECQKCGDRFRGNRDSCPSCGHTVFRPVE
ncbi:MAG: hypothetical protein ABEJ98_01485 [Candidatus Nanohaloarchaea archaeon]